MNILIVNQSVIDMFASFFTLMMALVEVDGTGMSRDSIYDRFVCYFWLARQPLFYFLAISTYGIVLIALDRYIAVAHSIWQNNNVSTACVADAVNPLNPKYFYIVHCASLSIFPVSLSFSYSTSTILGVRPQLTECGHYYSRGQS